MTRCKAARVFLAGLLVGCGILPTRHAGAQEPAREFATIIAEFRDSIPKLMEETQLPGLALAVVDRERVLWAEGFGFTDGRRTVPVSIATPFSVQSMAKSFTAVALLIAAQQGLVSLDEPITTYLPSFTVNSRFEEHPERRMTLRLLLSHRAGFTHEAPVGNNYELDQGTFEEHIASISRTWLRFPVGQRYSYSNLGVDLAGYILQVRSGVPFESFVRQNLLLPLGMTGSTFDQGEIARMPDRAIGHSRSLDTIPVAVPMIPAGGLYSTAADLARFVQFQLNRGSVAGQPLVAEPLLEQMWAMYEPDPRQTVGYGLGLGIQTRHGTHYLSHGGGGFGFRSHMGWFPEYGLGIVLLTNSDDHPYQNALPQAILDRFIAARHGEAAVSARETARETSEPHAVAPDRLAGLDGLYLYASGGYMIVVCHDGRLGTGPVEQFSPFTFLSEEVAVAEHRGEPFHYRFLRNPDGSAAMLVRLYDATVLDFNDGPHDPPGPDRPGWERYVGQYRYRIFGKPARTVELSRRNGYLYLDHMKLREHQPGLFFAPHGEALDLRGAVPTWRNIKLERVE